MTREVASTQFPDYTFLFPAVQLTNGATHPENVLDMTKDKEVAGRKVSRKLQEREAFILSNTSVAIDEDSGTYTGTILATDINGLPEKPFSISTHPAHAHTFTLDTRSGEWTYAPEADFNGTDTFTVTITDALGGTTEQHVDVIVKNVNDAPILDDIYDQKIYEDTTFILSLIHI